jgi:flavin-dependent dehydrogenase
VNVPVDLIVVGGGPVGLATAIEAAVAGMDVALLEPRSAPLDKACGEGLMPSAVHGLARLGVHPSGYEFSGIRYLNSDGVSAVACFRSGNGLGVRRTTLSQVLTARAAELGVTRLPQRADAVTQGPDWVEAAGLRARYLVAADGLHSTVRRSLGLDASVRAPARYGLRRHFFVQPWTDMVEVYWSEHAEAYVTPVGPDLVGVAILCPGGRTYDRWLAGFPGLRARLAGAEPATAVLGAGRLRQRARRHVQGNVLLVGDASGYVDALTGEGISIGMSCAREAVRCLVDNRPQDYESAWWRTTRRYRVLTGGLVRAASSPRVRRAIVPAAARLPGVFSGIVNSLG